MHCVNRLRQLFDNEVSKSCVIKLEINANWCAFSFLEKCQNKGIKVLENAQK